MEPHLPPTDVSQFLPLVRGIARRYKFAGIERDDLISEGARGLVEALKRFNGSSRFIHYAKFWIKKYIKAYVASHIDKINNVASEQDHSTAYLENEDNHPKRLFEQKLAIMDLKQIFARTQLSNDEISVLSYRFGLNQQKEESLKKIGLILECTGERVRQIEEKALKKLQKTANTNYSYKL